MDLTPENLQAVFLDSLALDSEGQSIRIKGIFNEFLFNTERLESHAGAIRGFLGRVSTWFYEDRGGGHICLALSMRRDGVRWGERRDVERLVVVGLGLGLVEFCLDRSAWSVFPGGLPYVRLKSDLFKLWATFRRPNPSTPDDSIVLAFDADLYRTPQGVLDADWFRPAVFKIADLANDPRHVAEAFYNRIIVDGFFDDSLPSWILDPQATLQVY